MSHLCCRATGQPPCPLESIRPWQKKKQSMHDGHKYHKTPLAPSSMPSQVMQSPPFVHTFRQSQTRKVRGPRASGLQPTSIQRPITAYLCARSTLCTFSPAAYVTERRPAQQTEEKFRRRTPGAVGDPSFSVTYQSTDGQYDESEHHAAGNSRGKGSMTQKQYRHAQKCQRQCTPAYRSCTNRCPCGRRRPGIP